MVTMTTATATLACLDMTATAAHTTHLLDQQDVGSTIMAADTPPVEGSFLAEDGVVMVVEEDAEAAMVEEAEVVVAARRDG